MKINILYNKYLSYIYIFTCFLCLQKVGSFSVHFCFLFVP